MKVSVEDIKKIKVGKPLIVAMEDRLACNTCRNLVSYVNMTYPVEGHKYRTHVTRENVVQISLVAS